MVTLEKNKKKAMLLAALFAVVMAPGCIPMDGEQAEDADESPVWTEGLTSEQIVKAMPIFVEETADSKDVQVNGIVTAKSALQDDSEVEKEILVTWAVPKGQLPFANWRVYEGTVEGDWKVIDVEVRYTENASDVLDIEAYKFSYPVNVFFFKHKCKFTYEQHIKYFKIEMKDHNGNIYENIVSFMVWPYKNPIQITLSEESYASAPSDVSILLNGGWDIMWQFTQETKLPLTTMVKQTIEPWQSVRFKIKTDFTGWGFGDDLVSRVSNSSFCKVTKVEGYPNGNIQSRLRYAFEDLPLDRVSTEPSKEFDYNDVILYVDIMKLPQ